MECEVVYVLIHLFLLFLLHLFFFSVTGRTQEIMVVYAATEKCQEMVGTHINRVTLMILQFGTK